MNATLQAAQISSRIADLRKFDVFKFFAIRAPNRQHNLPNGFARQDSPYMVAQRQTKDLYQPRLGQNFIRQQIRHYCDYRPTCLGNLWLLSAN